MRDRMGKEIGRFRRDLIKKKKEQNGNYRTENYNI